MITPITMSTVNIAKPFDVYWVEMKPPPFDTWEYNFRCI